MNKNQWFALGIGLFIFGWLMLYMGTPACFGLDDYILIACFIRKYAYAITGLISLVLGCIFIVLSWLEPKKK